MNVWALIQAYGTEVPYQILKCKLRMLLFLVGVDQLLSSRLEIIIVVTRNNMRIGPAVD